MATEVTAVVSGSFRYKDKIDEVIDTLEQTGITVLEPTKGWLAKSALELSILNDQDGIRPLPTEEGMSPGAIENRFLRALGSASLMHFMNYEGYIGNSMGGELGFALAGDGLIYAWREIDFNSFGYSYGLAGQLWIRSRVIVLPPEEVYDDYIARLREASDSAAADESSALGLWLPATYVAREAQSNQTSQ